MIAWPVLIALSAALSALLLWLHAPAALMIGPLVAGMVLAGYGAKVKFPVTPFVLAQGVVGSLVAQMVPITIVGDVVSHWELFTFGVVAVVLASLGIGWGMTRLKFLPGTTALWGTSPGAASVMTIMSESYGADGRVVALMQYLRVVLVAGVAALVAKLFGAHAGPVVKEIVWFPPVDWLALAGTLTLAIVGPLVARRLRIPAGAFLVPLVVGAVLVHFGLMKIELPPWLLAASYALIGWNIGLRFHAGPAALRGARHAAGDRLGAGVDRGLRRHRLGDGGRGGRRSAHGLSGDQSRRLGFYCHHRCVHQRRHFLGHADGRCWR